MRLFAFALLLATSTPGFGQQGSVISNGRIYLYNTESERRLVEGLIKQRQQIDSLNAQSYYWRNPTPSEVAAMESDWKEKNPLLTSHRMPNFAKRKIRVDRTEELQQKISELEARLSQFETSNPQPKNPTADQAKRKAAEYDAAFTASENRAMELYDFLSDPKSEGRIRIAEIDEALRVNGDPLYYDPNKPLIIAQMVAKELRIAPKPKKSNTKR